MAKKKKPAPGSDPKPKAPWILMAVTTSLNPDDQKEQMAYVRTPEGDRWVPMSETKGKVNIFGQLPEYKKKEFARRIYELIREEQMKEKKEAEAAAEAEAEAAAAEAGEEPKPESTTNEK